MFFRVADICRIEINAFVLRSGKQWCELAGAAADIYHPLSAPELKIPAYRIFFFAEIKLDDLAQYDHDRRVLFKGAEE